MIDKKNTAQMLLKCLEIKLDSTTKFFFSFSILVDLNIWKHLKKFIKLDY